MESTINYPASQPSDCIRRAITAFFRSRAPEDIIKTPSRQTSKLREIGGKAYVYLYDLQFNTVAVYRVRNDGILKRLKRWPEAGTDKPAGGNNQ